MLFEVKRMSRLLTILKNTAFSVTEAEFATVGNFWKNQVFFYKRDRLYYVTDGEADIILKEKTIHLQKGHLYLIPSHSVLTGKCNDFLSHHFIHFQFDEYAYNLFYAVRPKTEVEADEFDEHYFRLLEHNMLEKAKGPLSAQAELEINGIMQILISKFLPSDTLDDDIIQFLDIIAYIDANLHRSITVEELANKAALNKVYFSNIFSKHIGISPSQFIINRRLEKAMDIMRHSDSSLKEIAFKVGFDNAMYFPRIFKKKIGMTPSKFKAKSSGNNQK